MESKIFSLNGQFYSITSTWLANPLFSKDSIKEASLAPYIVIASKNILRIFL
jgi:hypothetical protein